MQKGSAVTGFQSEKRLVREYYTALEDARLDTVTGVLDRFLSSDHRWRGYHPFYELSGIDAVSETFWVPLIQALAPLQRRVDIFFAGDNALDAGGRWVVSMGHLMGLFDRPWLGIRPTGKLQFLRYAEFMRVENGKITETAFYIDIPHFMTQAGCDPFPHQTGTTLVQPGPQTHDGLLFDDADRAEGAKTLARIESMAKNLGTWQSPLPIEEELRLDWAEDMIWWGPHGIGATYTIDRYIKQHAGVFRASFTNRSSTGHVARLAEGHFGGFFGWPNFSAEPTGGFMGMPATGKTAEFRVIDIYRRAGDKLVENWVFIDLLHLWKQFDVDILGRLTALQEGPR